MRSKSELIRATGQPGQSVRQQAAATAPRVLCVVTPYTTSELTRTALRHSGACSDLDVYVRLVDVQVVPFPSPLDQPPIDRQHSERRLHDLLIESRLAGEATVLYTRDWLDGFQRVLDPQSLVVIATRKRWWPTREKRLACALAKAGHQVMLLPVAR
jgi:hypothetical protein